MVSRFLELYQRIYGMREKGISQEDILAEALRDGWAGRQEALDIFGAMRLGFVPTEEELDLLRRDIKMEALKSDNSRLKRENKKLKILANKVDRAVEAYGQAREPRPPVPIEEIKTEGTRQVLVTVSSDEHITSSISYERMHGINFYDMGIARQRMLYVAKRAATYINRYWREKNIRKIVDLNLGDKFQGVIHDAAVTNEDEQSEAVLHWINTKTDCYDYILRHCPGVEIFSVHLSGNHTRRTQKQDVNRPRNHDDYLSAKLLERDFRNEPRVQFRIPNSYFDLLNINEQIFIATHGQFIRAWAGIPFYGVLRYYKAMAEVSEKTDEYKALMIQTARALIEQHGDDLSVDHVRPIDRHWIQGHFHTCCRGIDSELGEIFMNGSLIGPEDFGISLAKASPPRQLFMAVHERHRVTDVAAINLEHIRPARDLKPLDVLNPITIAA